MTVEFKQVYMDNGFEVCVDGGYMQMVIYKSGYYKYYVRDWKTLDASEPVDTLEEAKAIAIQMLVERKLS